MASFQGRSSKFKTRKSSKSHIRENCYPRKFPAIRYTVRLFNTDYGIVTTQFLDMCLSSSSIAEGIFLKIKEALSKYNISWINCVGISLNNTSVNMGCRNSIKTRVQRINPAVSKIGCACRIVHIIARKAGEAYEEVLSLIVILAHELHDALVL